MGAHLEPYENCELPLTPALDGYETVPEGQIAERMAAVIQLEAPIERDRLCNLVRASFGIARSGRLVQEKNLFVLGTVPHTTTSWNDRTFIWKEGQDPACYDACRENGGRDVDQIAPEELLAAIELSLPAGAAQGQKLDRSELVSRVAATLGYSRVRSRLRVVLGEAVDLAASRGLPV